MKPIMRETYEGRVEHVGENTCVVMYDVNGSLVEQTYEKSQFISGEFPPEGTCVKIKVVLSEFEPEPLPALTEEELNKPSHRKPLEGPVEF
jgi:hypothetical protein